METDCPSLAVRLQAPGRGAEPGRRIRSPSMMAHADDDAARLEREEFIRGTVWPLVGDGSDPPAVDLERHRHGILEYRFRGGPRVFAKPLAKAGQGLAAYRLLREFWEHGFGDGEYRVVEPIAYLDEHRTVLIGAAPGTCLRDLRTSDWPTWEDGLRKAARWLAALHASPLRLGPADDSTRRALHLARRITATAARRPELETLLVSLLEALEARTPAGASDPEVQTHGRYHDEHVYVTSEHVTVIDLDRASRGDRAKDVAEFLHRLRVDPSWARLDPETAERASAAFVDEYRRHSAAELSALEFYWSYSVLFTLVARAGRAERKDTADREGIAFYEAEFAAIPERVASYVGERTRP
jgi:hypothetical protein